MRDRNGGGQPVIHFSSSVSPENDSGVSITHPNRLYPDLPTEDDITLPQTNGIIVKQVYNFIVW